MPCSLIEVEEGPCCAASGDDCEHTADCHWRVTDYEDDCEWRWCDTHRIELDLYTGN